MLKLKDEYQKKAVSLMIKKFGYKNVMAVPKIEKVVLNVGFGKLISGKSSEEQKKIQDVILNDLSLIAGQRPILTFAKKSISGFKTRKGLAIGAKVTLRKQKMYDFLERLIHIVLPRSRDFRGIEEKSFDQKGNLTLGIKEHTVFPEILPEKAKVIFGLEVTIAIKSKKRQESIELLKLLGFPIRK